MKDFPLDEIRNVGILGGGRAGKTSLAESLIYFNGGASALGSIDQGNTVMDFDPDEIERKNSHHSSLASLETARGKINLIDTPESITFWATPKRRAASSMALFSSSDHRRVSSSTLKMSGNS